MFYTSASDPPMLRPSAMYNLNRSINNSACLCILRPAFAPIESSTSGPSGPVPCRDFPVIVPNTKLDLYEENEAF